MLTTLKRSIPYLVFLALVGCGVQVEIAQPTPPTATPHSAAIAHFDGNTIIQSVAAPRLAFVDTQTAQAQLFMVMFPPEIYLIKDRRLSVSADYDVIWFPTGQGNGHVQLRLYTRTASDQPWKNYDTAEQDLTASTIPLDLHDSLTINVTADKVGPLQIQAEVGIVAYPANGKSVNPTSTTELSAAVLNDPGSIALDAAAFKPALGGLKETTLLIDWRNWAGGPCALNDKASADPGHENLQTACNVFKSGDLSGAVKALQAALEKTQSPEVRAQLYSLIGLVQSNLQNWDDAATNFENARDNWQSVGDALALSMSLNNLAVARAAQGNSSDALGILGQLAALRGQYADDAGMLLLQANLGHLSGDKSLIEAANSYFEGNKLPQAAVTKAWLK